MRTERCPSNTDTSSIGISRDSRSVANVCRNMCGLPVTSASSKRRRSERCQSATADFLKPLPDQKKYALPFAIFFSASLVLLSHLLVDLAIEL